MRKNKVISPSSKLLLTIKNLDVPKNKFQLSTNHFSLQKNVSDQESCNKRKLLSPRNFHPSKKLSSDVTKSSESMMKPDLNSLNKKNKDDKVTVICENVNLIEKIHLFGGKYSNQVIFRSSSSEYVKKVNNLQNLIVLSTLQDFTSIYLNFITSNSINISSDKKGFKSKIRWIIVCDAINSKNIEASFKETYQQAHFLFLNSILAVVNLINLIINNIVTWETSKNKFQILDRQKKFSKANARQQLSFQQIINMEFSQNNQTLPNQAIQSNDWMCIKQKIVRRKDQILSDIKVNSLYFCSTKDFQQFFKKQNGQKLHKYIFIYVNNLQQFDAFVSIEKLLNILLKHEKFYFFHLFENFHQEIDRIAHKKQLLNIYRLSQRQKKLIHELQDSQQNLFLTANQMDKIDMISLNQKQVFKIMLNFEAKTQVSSVVFIILKPQHLNVSQKGSIVSKSFNQTHKMIFLVVKEQISSQQFTESFKTLCIRENKKIPQFFIIQHNKMKISPKYCFERIMIEEDLDYSALKSQVYRKIHLKNLFMNEIFKNISKKTSIYVIESDKIDQSNPFISELSHFLGIGFKAIKQNDIEFSSSVYPIKEKIQQTKNKINIIFGKINSAIQKNEIFRSFLVIYLPKIEKLSMEKLLSTILKAYEKYFNLIDETISSAEISFQLSLNIFNIPGLSLFTESSSLSELQTQKPQIVRHFRLNQFQDCLKNIPMNSKYKKSSIKRIFYFIFQMDEFQEEFQALIDNARMKNDCQIQIYLKYGEQFIHRPKNGKYKFMKTTQLHNLVQTMIQKSKNSQQITEENDQIDQKQNKFQQINRLINNQSSIQQSPINHDSLMMITPAKADQKSTYSWQNSDIQLIKQQNPQNLPKQSQHQMHLFESKYFENSSKISQSKLYVFVHKTMPLKCLINRNQADYEILTYNQPNEALLLIPYLNDREFVVVFKKLLTKVHTQLKNNSTQKSYKSSSKTERTSKNLKFIELKEMGEHQVGKIIDSLVYKMRLKKLQSKQQKTFVNEVPLLVYQTAKINNSNEIRLKKIKSFVSLKKSQNKDYFSVKNPNMQKSFLSIFNQSESVPQQKINNEYYKKSSEKNLKQISAVNSSRVSKKSQNFSQHLFSNSLSKNESEEEYFPKMSSKFKESNEPFFDHKCQSFQEFVVRLKAKTSFSTKYFLFISQEQFVNLIETNPQKFVKQCKSIGITFYFFGQQKNMRKLEKKISQYTSLNFHHFSSPKQLLLKYFDPYLKAVDKASMVNKFKVSVSNSLILFRMTEEQIEKKKIPEKLWNVSNRSQKALSNKSIKKGSKQKASLLSISKISSSTSLNQNKYDEQQTVKKGSKPSQVLNYYYSKQLTKEKPLKNHSNMFNIVGSSGIKEMMKRQKIAFNKVKVNEYFACVQELMTILWQNGEKKYFIIILLTKEELQDLQSNIFFAEKQKFNLSDAIVLQAKEIQVETEQNQTIEYLRQLMAENQEKNWCFLQRELKQFQDTIEQIQAKIQYYVEDIFQKYDLLDKKGFEMKLIDELTQQYNKLLQHPSTDKKICVIICFVQDYDYLSPLINSIIYKQNQSEQIKLILQKVDSIEEALNLNMQLMIPRCLIIPSEWQYFKISNGIMIDYNLEHFERKLGIFLNNVLKSFLKKDKFSFCKKLAF